MVSGTAGRLRGELTEFVGRRAELALIRKALGEARLVTLTGPGGIGRTRLAVCAASAPACRRARWNSGERGSGDQDRADPHTQGTPR